MLFYFPHFVSFLQLLSLFCLENFELNKTKFPPCHVCGWDTLVCQPHPCSHILRSTHESTAYTMNGEHQKKVESISLQEWPGGPICADRHINSAICYNTQRDCDTRSTTDTLQQAVCKAVEDKAAWRKFRPPGPTVSETPRSFLCCRFATPIAYFSKRSVQIVPSLL